MTPEELKVKLAVRRKKTRENYKKKGICVHCMSRPAIPGSRACTRCQERNMIRLGKHLAKNAEALIEVI